MSSTEGARMRMDALDGIRALSALSVFVYHNSRYHDKLPGGGNGVEVFFILSGFLITLLLYREWDATGSIDFLGFYWRRFIRLVPAAVFFFVCLWVYLVAFGHEPLLQKNAFLAGLTPAAIVKGAALHFNSLTNYWLTGGEPYSPITHLWTLSVEQQFYMAWPLALFCLLRFNRFYVTCGLLFAVGCASMSINSLFMARDVFEGHTLQLVNGVAAPMYSLTFGSLAALLWQRFGCNLRIPSAALLMVGLALLGRIAYPLPNVLVDRLILQAGTIILVLGCADGRAYAAKALAFKPLVYLGQRSYGFYLWHLPFVYWVMRMDGPSQLFWSFALTMVMVEVSYKYIEQPALAFGRRLSERDKQARPQTPQAQVVTAAA